MLMEVLVLWFDYREMYLVLEFFVCRVLLVFNCLVNCFDIICDYVIGKCNGCRKGFKENYCN